MAVFEIIVGGYHGTEKIDDVLHDHEVATIKLRTQNELDVVLPGTGSTTLLDMLKNVAQQITSLTPPLEPGPEWTELMKEAPSGVSVHIAFGVRAEYKAPA